MTSVRISSTSFYEQRVRGRQLGIKTTDQRDFEAAEEHQADAIGMSGLLVKSTVIMKDNLAEMNQRAVAEKWPVMRRCRA